MRGGEGGGGGGHEEPFFVNVMSCLRTGALTFAKWCRFSLFSTLGTNQRKLVNYNSRALPSVFTYGFILPDDITCDKIFHISTLEVI